jgi:5-methylthioribose kinase
LLDQEIAAFLRETGLVKDLSRATLTTLTGGVASDIWKVETAERRFVIKKALPQLRVAQVWTAPICRNASEVDWLIEARKVAPAAAPAILASDKQAGLFAMEYFEPQDYPIWKLELHAGRADPVIAANIGRTIAAIHGATAGSADIARRFDNDATFHSIRIEPYIEATARVHQDLAEPLMKLAQRTLATKRTLVHGDVSPKNILVGPKGPIFLDAECAWYGEPAFDLAFCLNHLLLKCLWTPAAGAAFLTCFDSLAAHYLAAVTWEPPDEVEARAASLLPALFLARVDGKSPVEYVTAESDRDRVRRIARPLIATPPQRLAIVRQKWAKEISA